MSLVAGVVGRPHGLDGSFYVERSRAAMLKLGATVMLAGEHREILRRAGTDARPILRVTGIETRDAAAGLRRAELVVENADAPELGPDEWWAEELEGAGVFDGGRFLGTVRRLLALPSCECLEVERAEGDGELLVPLVRDAIRNVDVAARRIEIDGGFLGESG
jgi:16S rRNA processing protein RimM